MRTVWLAIILSILAAPVAAQWLRLPLPGTPRMSDGRPNLSAPTPRTADGRPDLSGIWLSWNWHRDNPDRGRLFLTGIDVPMQPWAEALYRERQGNQSKDDPEGFCLPAGIPEQMVNPLPWKIIQTPGVTVILFEQWANYRQIFTDGRRLPEISQPSWFGYSTGRWEGDTFVAETIGLNDRTWLGNDGHPHSEAMRITERFTRSDFGHMEVQFTFDDSKAFTKPWSATAQFQVLPDTELMEQICENQKWAPRQ
jgi:hypothetical protein